MSTRSSVVLLDSGGDPGLAAYESIAQLDEEILAGVIDNYGANPFAPLPSDSRS
jgi:hypothetical protein